MPEHNFYNILIYTWYAVGAAACSALFFIPAPYGRHSRSIRGSRSVWGPAVQARTGWLIMETASPLFFCLFLFAGNRSMSIPVMFFTALWLIHYTNRSFIYPFRMRGGHRPMSLPVVLMGFFFNTVNGYLNGRYLNAFGSRYAASWFADPRFIIGLSLFAGGFIINLHSDSILRSLRRPGETEYLIPTGGMFKLVSGANYFGEIIEWFGWACLTWSPPGLAFAVWTAFNLVPRAWTHHRWYLKQFSDYPENRKAIIPLIF